MMRQIQAGITATALMRANGFGITLAGMNSQKANLRPIRSKATMPSCAIIWHVWLASRVVFLVVHMRWHVRYTCSFIVSIAGNFTNSVSQIIRPMLWTLLVHHFSRSRQPNSRKPTPATKTTGKTTSQASYIQTLFKCYQPAFGFHGYSCLRLSVKQNHYPDILTINGTQPRIQCTTNLPGLLTLKYPVGYIGFM
jgi:hypothetical protein